MNSCGSVALFRMRSIDPFILTQSKFNFRIGNTKFECGFPDFALIVSQNVCGILQKSYLQQQRAKNLVLTTFYCLITISNQSTINETPGHYEEFSINSAPSDTAVGNIPNNIYPVMNILKNFWRSYWHIFTILLTKFWSEKNQWNWFTN